MKYELCDSRPIFIYTCWWLTRKFHGWFYHLKTRWNPIYYNIHHLLILFTWNQSSDFKIRTDNAFYRCIVSYLLYRVREMHISVKLRALRNYTAKDNIIWAKPSVTWVRECKARMSVNLNVFTWLAGIWSVMVSVLGHEFVWYNLVCIFTPTAQLNYWLHFILKSSSII